MQRPKWLSGWGKGKNLFEGSLIIDTPDIKVVEAHLDNRLVLVAVGTSQPRVTAESAVRKVERIAAESRFDMEWKIFYDSTALTDFIPFNKAKDFMAGAVAVSSGSGSVYNINTVYIASNGRSSKGNSPLLLDYEVAKKIERARKKK
jgi:hypothetical protein